MQICAFEAYSRFPPMYLYLCHRGHKAGRVTEGPADVQRGVRAGHAAVRHRPTGGPGDHREGPRPGEWPPGQLIWDTHVIPVVHIFQS